MGKLHPVPLISVLGLWVILPCDVTRVLVQDKGQLKALSPFWSLNSLAARVWQKERGTERVQKGKDVFNAKSLFSAHKPPRGLEESFGVFITSSYPGSRQITHSSVAFEIDIADWGSWGGCVCVFWPYLKGYSKCVILSEQTQ